MHKTFSLDDFHKKYETDINEVVINSRKFNIMLPKDLSRYINPGDVLRDFPLWAKIWPASWVLAGYLAEIPVSDGRNFLEIGGGVGLISIVAASCGHQITMTEYNSDALQFARANAMINQCPGLNIRKLDWNKPRLTGRFDYIVASEVSYKKTNITPLLTLFKNSLAADGQVLMAAEMRKLNKDYLKALEKGFNIRILKKILRSENEEIKVLIFRMSLKGEQ